MSGPVLKPWTCTLLPQLLPASSGTSDDGHAGDARQRRQLVFEPLEERQRPLGRVAVQLGRDAEGDHVVDLQPEIDAADVEQAPGEQAGRDQQRHRQRDLRRGERRAEPRRRPWRPTAGPPGPSASPTRSGRVLWSAGNRPNSRPVPIVSAAANSSTSRVERQLNELAALRRAGSRRSGRASIARPAGRRRRQAPRAGSDSVEQLRDQLPAARAERQPHRHLARRGRPRGPAAGSRCSRRR